MKKKEILIILAISVWITLLTFVIPRPVICPLMGTTCSHSTGFPFVWYRVNDLWGKEIYSNQLILFSIVVVALLVWQKWLLNRKLKVKDKQLIIRNFIFPSKKQLSEVTSIEMYLPFLQPNFHQKLFGLKVIFRSGKSIKTGPIFPQEYKSVIKEINELLKSNPNIKIDKFIEEFLEEGIAGLFMKTRYSNKKRFFSVFKVLGITLVSMVILVVLMTLLVTLFN